MIMLKSVGVDPVPNYTETSKEADRPLGRLPPCLRSGRIGGGVFVAQCESGRLKEPMIGYGIRRRTDGYVLFFGRPRP